MPKPSIADLRRILRYSGEGYLRPLVPVTLLELIGKPDDGTPYQWDLETINGIQKITMEFNPTKIPSIMEQSD